MAKTMTYKCDACGAAATKSGKPFDQKTLNLHKAMHCPQKGGGAAAQKCCASPAIRLLTSDERGRLAAHGHTGYNKICDSCQEVL